MSWKSIDDHFADVERRQGEVFTGTLIGTTKNHDATPEYNGRKCMDCGADISQRGNRAKRCIFCAQRIEAERALNRYHTRRAV
jgi:DNA-directed RNA polymerase subunit RPC12/RpoP